GRFQRMWLVAVRIGRAGGGWGLVGHGFTRRMGDRKAYRSGRQARHACTVPPTLPCDPTGGSMPMLQLRPWRYPALAFAIGLLLAVGIATVWGLAELRGGVDRLEHSHQVLGTLDGALGSLRSAEAS